MQATKIANLHVESGGSGEGPTVVLLHGVLRQIADLAPIIQRLPKSVGWMAIDFPGHGESAPNSDGYKVRNYADAITRLLDRISHTPMILFGHSLGAMVAAKVATQFPGRIAGVILADPPFSTMGSRIKETSLYLQFRGTRDLLHSRSDRETLLSQLRELPVRRASDLEIVRMGDVRDEASLQTYANYLMQVDPRVLDPIVEAQWLDGYDFLEVAQSIAAPVLLIQAEAKLGGMLTELEAEQFQRATSDCRLVKIPASHLIHATHADLLAAEIDSFLQSVSHK